MPQRVSKRQSVFPYSSASIFKPPPPLCRCCSGTALMPSEPQFVHSMICITVQVIRLTQPTLCPRPTKQIPLYFIKKKAEPLFSKVARLSVKTRSFPFLPCGKIGFVLNQYHLFFRSAHGITALVINQDHSVVGREQVNCRA
jgi:hypothetical protein